MTLWPQWPGFTQQPGEGCFTPPPGIRWWSAPRVPMPMVGARPGAATRVTKHSCRFELLNVWWCSGAPWEMEPLSSRGFDKDWQNSIGRVQSGSEKLDRAWQKAYIKIWRLQNRNMYLLKISVGTLFAEPDLKLLLEITIAKFVLYILHCLFRKCTISWFGNEFLIIIAGKIFGKLLIKNAFFINI